MIVDGLKPFQYERNVVDNVLVWSEMLVALCNALTDLGEKKELGITDISTYGRVMEHYAYAINSALTNSDFSLLSDAMAANEEE